MSILPGSAREPMTDVVPIGPAEANEWMVITVVLRRGPATAEDVAAVVKAVPPDVEVLSTHIASRRLRLAGPVSALSALFGVRLTQVWHEPTGRHYRHRVGTISVPDDWDGVVVAVLGLDDRPAARPHIRLSEAPDASYTPVQVAAAYDFPTDLDGSGSRIALLELGGGYADSDLDAYFSELGITPPAVTDHLVDGAINTAGADPDGADAEVLLDIEIAGALAPGADIDVWFAPNTDAGFLDAVSEAIHATPTPTVLSISWGQAEDAWTGQARTALDAALADAGPLGVTVTVAAGDTGSSDSEPPSPHVDFPASSTHVIACGGTTLVIGPDGAISSEVVWNDGGAGTDSSGIEATGGGFSSAFARPSWQVTAIDTPGEPTGRGVPDVAGNADPDTGYVVRVDGESTVIGGTSAVAPLWAALIARLVQATSRPFGELGPTIYPLIGTGAFHDITNGSNGAFTATPGWDPCTGLGSPNGAGLLSVMTPPSTI